MATQLTLPSLQSTLDRLSKGKQVTLARSQADRLFGLNDLGSARMARFAISHDCIVVHADSCVVFEKRS